MSRSDAAERARALCADVAECVMQVDEGEDAQPASSGDVAGCDEDLFEEAREEFCFLSRCRREQWCVSSVSRSDGS